MRKWLDGRDAATAIFKNTVSLQEFVLFYSINWVLIAFGINISRAKLVSIKPSNLNTILCGIPPFLFPTTCFFQHFSFFSLLFLFSFSLSLSLYWLGWCVPHSRVLWDLEIWFPHYTLFFRVSWRGAWYPITPVLQRNHSWHLTNPPSSLPLLGFFFLSSTCPVFLVKVTFLWTDDPASSLLRIPEVLFTPLFSKTSLGFF